MKPHRRALLQLAEAYIAKANNDLKRQLTLEGFADPSGTVDAIEALEEDVAEALEREKSSYINDILRYHDLQEYKRRGLKESRRQRREEARMATLLEAYYKTLLPALTEEYIKEVDPELAADGVTRRTESAAQDWARELEEIMVETSGNDIERGIDSAIERGRSAEEYIEELKERDVYTRAHEVAETEVLRAHSMAQEEAATQAPAMTGRAWVHNWPQNPRENHKAMDGQIALDGQPFEMVGADGRIYHPMAPRDASLPAAETIHCHCTTRPVTNEEILALPLAERQRMQQEAMSKVDAEYG